MSMSMPVLGILPEFQLPIERPAETFALIMFIMVVGPMVFERLRMPGIIGLIALGIVVGPGALGLFEREGIFVQFGDAGLLYLMFLAGLEINLRRFSQQRRDSGVFGATTFLIPQIGGAVGARLLFGFSWPTSVLLASMFASHTLVPYPIVMKLGIAKNRAVSTAVGGTIITDTAALLVLAVVAETVENDLGLLFFGQLALGFGALVAVTLLGLPRLAGWFFSETEPDDPAEFAFVLTACFTVSAAAYWVGMEPIIGAFLAGLVLGGQVPENSVLMNRLQFVGSALFIPIFLLSVGMLVDLSVLFTEWGSWAIAIYMCVGVTVTKWAGAQLAGRALRLTDDQTNLVFGLSVNQAAATLAAVMVGLRIGIFDATILNGTIMMILFTCIVGPWVTNRYGRRVSLKKPLETDGDVPDRPERILVAVDWQEAAGPLMDFALLLRQHGSEEPIYPLNVVEEDDEAHVAAAEGILGPAVIRAVSARVPVQAVTRIDPNTSSGILRAISELRASTVVMGWEHGATHHHLVFHSIPDRVIEYTRRKVFMCRVPRPLNTVKRLVLLAPPLIERQGGLSDLLRDIRNLATQATTSVLLVAPRETAHHIGKRLHKQPPVDYTLRELEDWRGLPELLRNELRPEDALVLLSVRRARLAWQPRLERWPRELAEEFPQHDFIVAYAAEKEAPQIAGRPATDSKDEEAVAVTDTGLVIRDIVLGQNEPDLQTRLQALLWRRFNDESTVNRILAELLRMEPVELTPGAALLHAHIPEVDDSEVIIGVGQAGVSVESADNPVRLLLVLLSGANQPASRHLHAMAGVAGLVQIPDIIDRLAQAGDRSEAERILMTPPPNP